MRHDLGYREWIGKRNRPLIRPLYVAQWHHADIGG